MSRSAATLFGTVAIAAGGRPMAFIRPALQCDWQCPRQIVRNSGLRSRRPARFFCEVAAAERLTIELIDRLRAFFERAQRDRDLRFDP
jgi:hypothetical protein